MFKYLIIIFFNYLVFNAFGSSIEYSKRIEDLVFKNLPDSIKTTVLIIPISIDACYTCNSPKVNSLLKNFKDNFNNAITMVVVESEIPGDAFSLKNRYNYDYFIEDTNLVLFKQNIMFPNVIIVDNNKNMYLFNFYSLIKYMDKLKKFINPINFKAYKSYRIKEYDNFYFSIPVKPVFKENILYFFAKRRNEVLDYNISSNQFSLFFKPRIDYISRFSNIDPKDLDLIINALNNKVDFIFEILSFDYDLENDKIYLLINLLSKVDRSTHNILMHKNRGILTIDKFNKYKYTKFKEKQFVEFNDLACNGESKYILIDNKDDQLIDSLPVILKIVNNNEFDTLVFINNLNFPIENIDKYYKPVILKIGANQKFYLLSQNKNSKYRIFNGIDSINSSFVLSGVFDYYSDFIINDLMIVNDKIYIIALDDKLKILLQIYNIKGKLINEYIWYSNESVVKSSFVINKENKIIIFNKYRYKRWVLDFLNL